MTQYALVSEIPGSSGPESLCCVLIQHGAEECPSSHLAPGAGQARRIHQVSWALRGACEIAINLGISCSEGGTRTRDTTIMSRVL